MPDIIGARCLTCSNVIRVSAKYGGQKAKCPKCNGIIVIPTPWDSTMGIVPDTELPQVAYEPAPEEAALPPEADADEAPAQSKTGGHRKAAGRQTGTRPARRPPPASGGATNRRPAPGGNRSNTGLVVGLVIGAVVIAGVAVAIIASNNSKKQKTDTTINVDRRDPAKAEQAAARQSETELYARLDEFVSAYNKCDSRKIAEFYVEAKRKDVEKYFNEHYENRWFRYENHAAPTLQAGRETAVMQVAFDRIILDRNKKEDEKGHRTEEKGMKRTINWSKVDGAWLITDNPEK